MPAGRKENDRPGATVDDAMHTQCSILAPSCANTAVPEKSRSHAQGVAYFRRS